jgi:hypothetical protein
MKAERRAWLGVTAINITGLELNGRVVVTARITNSGPTPAKKTVTRLMARFAPASERCSPRWHDVALDQTRTSTAVLFAQSGTTLVLNHKAVVTPAVLSEMSRDRTWLCVNVLTTYTDIFDESHESETCGFAVKHANTGTRIAPILESCNRAN